jgi:hypothetical protein
MNWLMRLKKVGHTPVIALQNFQKVPSAGFVGGRQTLPRKSESGSDIETARLALFTDRGLSLNDAQISVGRLRTRDRERDDRRLCLECRYLSGGPGAWQCSQWQMLNVRSPALPADLVLLLLQRCKAFKPRL